jgi:hypothetical protein
MEWYEVVLLVVVVLVLSWFVPRIANGSFPSPPKFPKETGIQTAVTARDFLRHKRLTRHMKPGTKVQALDCVTPHSARLA